MAHPALIPVLKSHQEEYAPVVPFDPVKDSLLLLDLTEGNKNISASLLDDIDAFIGYINNELKTRDSRYAIGGYNEHRTIYSRSDVFDAATPGDEPRRLHL